MIPKLYLYIDNFSFSDYYSANCIACEAFMPNKKGAKTLSRNTQNFLFLTHKKIEEKSRKRGISDSLTCWPVVLEFDFEENRVISAPVVFVTEAENGCSLTCGDLKDYDAEKYLGCYVYTTLPFSSVSKILFENETQIADSDKSMFPDFMWRADIVDILNKDAFAEDFELRFDDDAILQSLTTIEAPVKVAFPANKYLSAILQFIDGTKEWKSGKYQASFDSVLQEYFDIKTDTIRKILSAKNMPVPDELFQGSSEHLNLIPENFDNGTESDEQQLYNTIVQAFLSNTNKCEPNTVHELLIKIKENLNDTTDEKNAEQISKIIDSIEGCFLNSIGCTVDNIIQNIVSTYSKDSVLIALLFVIKNPEEYEKFVRSLSLYRADSITTRRAMVLWGFLNGSRGIPVRMTGRDNIVLWSFIEWKFAEISNSLWKFTKPMATEDLPCGIAINSEEIITFEEVYDFLISHRSAITNQFLKEIYNAAKNMDRKLSKTDPYCEYILTDNNFYSKLPHPKDSLKPISKAELNAINKSFAKKYKELMSVIQNNPVMNYDGIYQNLVSKKPSFKKIWDLIEDRIKEFYISQRGKQEKNEQV